LRELGELGELRELRELGELLPSNIGRVLCSIFFSTSYGRIGE